MPITPIDRQAIQWTAAQGANLYSTGASGSAAIRPVQPVNPVESVDKIGEGVTLRLQQQPTDPSPGDRDWTEPQETKLQEDPQEPPKEPISKQLIEHIQSLWRASAMAVDAAQEAQKTDQHERNALQLRSEPLTYEAPKIKRTGG